MEKTTKIKSILNKGKIVDITYSGIMGNSECRLYGYTKVHFIGTRDGYIVKIPVESINVYNIVANNNK